MCADDAMASDNGIDLSASAFRKLGYQVVHLIAEVMALEASDPIMLRISGRDSRALFSDPVPQEGLVATDVLRIVKDAMANGVRRNGHPRFFAYVMSSA